MTKPVLIMKENEPNLNFAKVDTQYATHSLHSFAAKCPPQLARWGIDTYSGPGDTILDPMCGSGTTLVEVRLSGRNGHGVDIDPLAQLLTKVKVNPIPADELNKAIDILLIKYKSSRLIWKQKRPENWRENIFSGGHSLSSFIPNLPRLERWFLPEVAIDLALLKETILRISVSEDIKDFFWVAFSSLIIARTSVANARDLVHSRHHYKEHMNSPDVLVILQKKLKRMYNLMKQFEEMCNVANCGRMNISVHNADARKTPFAPESVDMILTSPPYFNALDYTRAHAFSVAWLEELLGISYSQYVELGRRYIGSERGVKSHGHCLSTILEEPWASVPLAREIFNKVGEVDSKKALTVGRYFRDVYLILNEMCRVLRPNRFAVLVICPSHIRKVEIPTHDVFSAIGNRLSKNGYFLRTVEKYTRTIDDRKRLLPYMQEAFGNRMRTEYVLVLQKLRRARV